MRAPYPAPVEVGQFKGDTVHEVTLRRPGGLEARVLTWGAVIRDLSWPVANGGRLPLTLGFESFAPYPVHSPYFGAIVGRYANRIAQGRFTLTGQEYLLDRNEGGRTTLHGGGAGFARRIWHIADLTDTGVTLALTSADGDQGFPGTLHSTCTYTLSADNQLEVLLSAQTDQPTPVNLAQHAYFNLDGGADLSNHSLQIFADTYTPAGPDQIPTGQILPIDGTAFDFRQPRMLGQSDIAFDHNFVLSDTASLRRAARLESHKSGISMLVQTTKPGLQFYDGHMVNAATAGHGGRHYGANAGLCLETQFYPDSPNQPGFPDSILQADTEYSHRTVYSFDQ
jgi:aldose 1-epimerase